jgi:hypothetical protein
MAAAESCNVGIFLLYGTASHSAWHKRHKISKCNKNLLTLTVKTYTQMKLKEPQTKPSHFQTMNLMEKKHS